MNMKIPISHIATIILLLTASLGNLAAQHVKTGIDVLEENGFKQVRGKRIGLVTNPTGVDRYLNSTVDVLFNAPDVELVALFGPEHGVRGNAHAGEHVAGQAVDSRTGVPIFSLYGKSRMPSASQLEGLDAIVYDIQDIGCRSYTYISTMGNVMKVAAMEDVEMIILDRPNPLGGLRVEGPGVDDSLISFVGQYNIPYVYGLTCGELAMLLNEEGMLKVTGSRGQDSTVRCRLTVVRMEGWTRSMSWDDTGLMWVPTSPHIPTPEAAYFYPATGILGELGCLSTGIGYTLPFGMIACEDMDADLLASRMNALYLPGLLFRPVYATPFYGSLKGKETGGVQIYITDFKTARLSEIQFYAVQVIADIRPEFNPFNVPAQRLEMFDKVTGSKAVRMEFSKRLRYEDIFHLWNDFAEKFQKMSQKYYLYGIN